MIGCLGAQLVGHPTLDLSSGLDLRVVSLSPVLDSTLCGAYVEKKKMINSFHVK